MIPLPDKRALYGALRKARSVTAFCGLLGVEKRQLELLARQPKYKVFHVPKNESSIRLIEDPPPLLKRFQRSFNIYLQSAYYFEKTNASHGFVANDYSDNDKRNILTNARKHLKRPWLLQLDLLDFFHHVSQPKILAIFLGLPFNFTLDLSELLSLLTTYQGRLPMGAPTSPVLSNFACRDLDDRLLELAKAKCWVYTRYVDDLSFSALRTFSSDDQFAIRTIIEEEGFKINTAKTQLLGPNDAKVITGILLRGRGELQPEFLQELKADLNKLASVVEAQNFQGEISTPWVEKMKQQTRGKIAFAGFVLGKKNSEYHRLRDAYYTAIQPPDDDFGAVSWKGFHYLVSR